MSSPLAELCELCGAPMGEHQIGGKSYCPRPLNREAAYDRIRFFITETIARIGDIEDHLPALSDEELSELDRYAKAIRSIPLPWLR